MGNLSTPSRVRGSNDLAAIAQFCQQAKDKPRTVAELYQQLAAPPYGVKQGTIPVLLAAVLLHNLDEVSVYKDGTFVPVLGAEHFELLVKAPERFAVKYIEIAGLRSSCIQRTGSGVAQCPPESPA
ncbi:hypothetical protein HC928_21195, partial [bacterium]|nr:hypothetical protein [bacterium]